MALFSPQPYDLQGHNSPISGGWWGRFAAAENSRQLILDFVHFTLHQHIAAASRNAHTKASLKCIHQTQPTMDMDVDAHASSTIAPHTTSSSGPASTNPQQRKSKPKRVQKRAQKQRLEDKVERALATSDQHHAKVAGSKARGRRVQDRRRDWTDVNREKRDGPVDATSAAKEARKRERKERKKVRLSEIRAKRAAEKGEVKMGDADAMAEQRGLDTGEKMRKGEGKTGKPSRVSMGSVDEASFMTARENVEPEEDEIL